LKPWWEYIINLLAGLWTKSQLGSAGASQDALQGAITTQIDLPTLYDVPGPPAGIQESRDLAHAHPELTRRYMALKAGFAERTGSQLFETCTWRSQAMQMELYQRGRRGIAGEKPVTKIDGVTRKSRHMVYPAEAIDVCVDSDPGPGKHAVWDKAAYVALGPLADEHGLIWGGRFHGFGDDGDFPHLELPAGDYT